MNGLNAPATTRLKIAVRGAVQGVGFRPFVHRLAAELGLAGWVNNSSQGVLIEAEGSRAGLEQFLLRLQTDKPPRSFIQSLESWWLDATGCAGFQIRPSDAGGGKTAILMPDLAACPECMREVFDPRNRRHLYPFTNCTHCGPRFSIVESLPYDRANTSMKRFALCPQCEEEYRDPANRRFHAQPNACPRCGPHLELWDAGGAVLAAHHPALLQAARTIRDGKILALKGIGGFQLMVDARDLDAVRRLRRRKQREEKPFAVMYPSLEAIRADCRVADAEARLLQSPESPIVLLKKLAPPAPRAAPSHPHPGMIPNLNLNPNLNPNLDSVAPANPNLGVMLPYSPLHHLLLSELNFPVVATSGNLSDEPICIDEREALQRLRHIADVFLVHNRPIVRHVDDSVARVALGCEQILRRARGYAPLPIRLADGRPATALDTGSPVLAVGGHLKNTVALAIGPQVFVSQHIGDLETTQSYEAFLRVISDFGRLYEADPRIIAHDGHPNYLSTQFANLLARKAGRRGVAVQHHIAHVLACAAENELAPPLLGVSWDGTGYGGDGTVWGGEFFVLAGTACRRVARMRQFRLPGGEQAVKEPRRAALGMLYELFGENALFHSNLRAGHEPPRASPPTPPHARGAEGRGGEDSKRFLASVPALGGLLPIKSFAAADLQGLTAMLRAGVHCPLTSSAGRLFDAVAALLGLRQSVRFEGQAAMELEFAIAGINTEETYPFEIASQERIPRTDDAPCAPESPRTYSPSLSRTCEGESQEEQASSRLTGRTEGDSILVMDWGPMVQGILADLKRELPVGTISAKFHNALAEVIVAVAKQAGHPQVALSGGCFQNRYLTERATARLAREGFRPYCHQRIPPNDGGIAVGQIVAVLMGLEPLEAGRPS
jgi:hydrogenase maturation protein HypF